MGYLKYLLFSYALEREKLILLLYWTFWSGNDSDNSFGICRHPWVAASTATAAAIITTAVASVATAASHTSSA